MIQSQQLYDSCPTVKNYKEGYPVTAFMEITTNCNLKCKIDNEWFCYFYKKNQPIQEPLTDLQWLDKIEKIKLENESLIISVFVGGEPLIRKKIIEKSIERGDFLFNIIATNGTLKLPNWNHVLFVIGMNGLNGSHDIVRGKGTYKKIESNIRARKNVVLHPVINARNYAELEDFVKYWNNKVLGINFGWYVPSWHSNVIDATLLTDKFEVNRILRDEIVKKLLELKNDYPESILHSKREIELMSSSEMTKANYKNCFFWTGTYLTYDPAGNIKRPCPLQGNCFKCNGSSQGHAIYREKNIETILEYQRIEKEIIKMVIG